MIIAFDEYKSPVLTTGKWNHYNINKGQSYQFFTGIDPEGIFFVAILLARTLSWYVDQVLKRLQ